MILQWKTIPDMPTAIVAQIGTKEDGVTFSLCFQSTCYRRGCWKLLVEVCYGPAENKWGCFDEQDQPMRYYHARESALLEADRIAAVLLTDRMKVGPLEVGAS